ncbi:MAG: S1-like domain-containing RNA-binding protein [Calditrichaceae bacterium]
MLEIGKINRLTVKRATRHGAYLADEQGNEALLPVKYVSDTLRMEDKIDVFIFTDSEDRITATTQIPLAKRDEFACLKVKDVVSFGAFLDWGLDKDLFVPYREQLTRMKKGQSYLVYLYLDEKTNRLVASSKIRRFLDSGDVTVEKGEKVKLLIGHRTDLGVNVIINNRYEGLIFKDDLYAPVKTGDRLPGYIKNIRPDKKIDIVLHKPGFEAIEPNAQRILLKIRQNNGYLNLNDNSSPDEIKETLHISKKAFKKAIGILFKKRFIRITDKGLYLVNQENDYS